ncbi:MAG: transposase [Anaerolineae bacterium]
MEHRLDWLGAYDFSHGQCLIWHQESCDSESTVAFSAFSPSGPKAAPNQQTVIIWDGATCHKAAIVRQQAAVLGFTLIQLPAYSPDLNPIEGLWKWMREELTQHHCYKYLYQLERACFEFAYWTAST